MLDQSKVLESEWLPFIQIEFGWGYRDDILDRCILSSNAEELEA